MKEDRGDLKVCAINASSVEALFCQIETLYTHTSDNIWSNPSSQAQQEGRSLTFRCFLFLFLENNGWTPAMGSKSDTDFSDGSHSNLSQFWVIHWAWMLLLVCHRYLKLINAILLTWLSHFKYVSNSLDSDGGLRMKSSLAKVPHSTELSSYWLLDLRCVSLPMNCFTIMSKCLMV